MMAGSTQPPGATKYCHACGATIDMRAELCPRCGVRQGTAAGGSRWGQPASQGAPPSSKFCYACQARIDYRAEICPRCGVRQPALGGVAGGLTLGDITTRSGKSKLAASLLAIFLGSFGIHKFYLGDTTLGIVYLIFFWTGIPGIIGFVEGIIWLTQSNEAWLAKYGDR